MKFAAVVLVLSLASAYALVPISLYGSKSERVEGRYMVKFAKDARMSFERFKQKRLSDTMVVYDFSDYMGFSSDLTEDELRVVQEMPGIDYIEPDIMMHALGEQTNVAAWGIDRSDQRGLPLDAIFRWNDAAAGTGSQIFILDTGIDTGHAEFTGRAQFTADCTTFGACSTGADPGDPNGHGTHCAGSAMSRLYGIAKNATVHNVRCLGANGSGSVAGIVNAIQLVAGLPGTQKVISLSLGGGFSAALNDAVDAAFRVGTISVVAAGNSNSNACNDSPASASLALTVAASDQNDIKASFSSFGACVDIYAPGVSILSTQPNGGSALFSGTSMSTPHVAGAVAQILSRGPTTAEQVVSEIIGTSTPNVIGNNPAGTVNRLLFTFQ